MANLKTDSALSRRIVHAFLDFLDSVEPAPGVDVEGLEVARECLAQVFRLNSSSTVDRVEPGLLIDFFRSLEPLEAAAQQNVSVPNPPEPPLMTQVTEQIKEPYAMGVSKDELFGQFFAALEKIHFFKQMPDGNDDPSQLDKATRLFHDALNEMEKTGCQSSNQNSLAETLKSQGNKAMQSKLYADAIELYSCAIALCENNAVYYCNRAAAYTQIHNYTEAFRDCLKSIEIDPNYSKAYSRLGLAYYAQGNYRDAIDKGFKKALELDPNNESVKENIRVAAQKLKEEQLRTQWDQSMGSFTHDNQSCGGSTGNDIPSPFASMTFDPANIPVDFASMFSNMAANAFTGEQPQERQGENRNTDGSGEPEIRLGGNLNVNFGENMPEELRGALRSMMGMLSGAARHGTPQDTMNGTPPTN